MYTLDANLIKNMFDKIAFKYDFINNLISFGTHYFVKKKVISNLKIEPNTKVLDLCCGTGDLGKIIKKIQPSCDVVGIDFSSQMIELARKNNPNITYWEMDATTLSFEKNSFDYIVMGFGLRNIEQKNKTLEEVHRVLKANGKFLHLDFGISSIFNGIYDNFVLFISKIFIKDTKPLKYLILSKKRFLSSNELIDLFKFNKLFCVQKDELCFKMISYQIMKKNSV